MNWLNDEQLKLFSRVLDDTNLLPKNKKRGLKLRNISFYNSDTKSVKQMVPYIVELESGKKLKNDQYYNALKNAGLIDSDNSINPFGRLFLEFLHKNNDEVYNEITLPKDIRSIDERYIISLELIILLAVNCNREKITALEVLDNIKYLKDNILDTMIENEQQNFNLANSFPIDNDEFFLLLQGINYQGFEIKKLIHLREDLSKFKSAYIKAYEECPKKSDGLSSEEMKYYEQVRYFKYTFQKDIRFRVRMTFCLSLIFEGSIFPNSISHFFFTDKEKQKFIEENSLDYILEGYNQLIGKTQEDKVDKKDSALVIDKPHQRIFFGAPGTGKSYKLDEEAKGYFVDNYERVTFHPNYMYGNFVGSFKPFPKFLKDKNGIIKRDDDGNIQETITYEYIPGILITQLVKAYKNQDENYLLLVEEINRANVAAVFGDIFQLLDRDKNGQSEYSIATSKELKEFLKKELEGYELKDDVKNNLGPDFSRLYLPSNFYIWATMNSADQGVMPIDTAFRRRWEFRYLGINEAADLNTDEFSKYKFKVNSKEMVNWDNFRRELNKNLSLLNIPEDKLIGPYFVSKSILEGTNLDKLTEIIKDKVLMYLYEDAAKAYRSLLFSEGKYSTYSTVCKYFDENALHLFKNTLEVETEQIDGDASLDE